MTYLSLHLAGLFMNISTEMRLEYDCIWPSVIKLVETFSGLESLLI